MKCLQCGDDLCSLNPRKLFCSQACRKKYIAAKQTALNEKLSSPTPTKTREQWIQEADECNLDYGTYRALREQGKSFDELKATADARKSSIHFHGKVRLKRI